MGNNSKAAMKRVAGAVDGMILLSESMQQASALLADEPQASTSFLSVVALGNVSAGKSAVSNSLTWMGSWVNTLGQDLLTPKGPNNVFWQHSDFGQLATNGVFIFFL